MGTPSLVLGAVNLHSTAGPMQVQASGTTRGNPVPIEVAVKSWLQDGSVVVTQGYDNREVNIRVRMFGTDGTALAALESALVAELNKPNTLTWTPPSGPASVFVVVTSSLEFDDSDDEGEGQDDPWRTYNIRLVCAAFTRSTAEVSALALPASGATTTTLDTCAATTGWTGTVNGGSSAPAVVSGAVVESAGAAAYGVYTIVLQKTFAATTSAAKLLVVDWKPSVPGPLTVTGDGVPLPLIAEGASPTSGFTRSWFYVAAATLAVTVFTNTSDAGTIGPIGGAPTRSLSIDNVAVTNQTFPTVGTARQQLRSLQVLGSAPAPGSLAIESPTAALGDSLIYVYRADDTTRGYVPSLRQFRTAGPGPTVDATMVSGSRELMSGAGITLSIPMALFPRGNYVLFVRVGYSSAISPITHVVVTRSTVLGGNALGSIATNTLDIPVSTTYSNIAVARFPLPTVDLDPKTPGTMQINLTETAGTISFDEAWLFNMDLGQLIWVDCGTGAGAVGGNARRIFVEPATVISPRPRLQVGHSADRSDAYFPQTVKSWQPPRFRPTQVNVLAVTPNATDAVISLRHFPYFHTNATI